MIELFQHAIKQPEANPELFYLLEGQLLPAAPGYADLVTNLPLYFILHLATESGFQIQGNYSTETPIFDLNEGAYIQVEPVHQNFVTGFIAEIISKLQHIKFYNDLENIKLNRQIRTQILTALLHYISFHITDFKELKSLPVLKEVLN